MIKRAFDKITNKVSDQSLSFVEIDLLGRKKRFFGDTKDQYFRDLQAHSAQNELLYRLASHLDLSGSNYIDIGANIGVTAQMVQIIHPNASVTCLEPSPKAFFYLQKNANPEMKLLNIAAGASIGDVSFYEADFLAGSSISLEIPETPNDKVVIKVPMTTIDALMLEEAMKNVKLIKIDVEGFELEVLKGALNTIASQDPVFLCEFNSYAIAANGKYSPYVFLEQLIRLFGKFYGYRSGKSVCIENDKDARDFFYQNMVTHGCVEDIYFGGGLVLP